VNSIFKEYKLKVEDKMLSWIGNEFALVITEPAGVNFENNSFAIFRAKNIVNAKKDLISISQVVDRKNNTATMEETYNGHAIGFIRLSGVLPALFGNMFSRITKMYYTDIDDYIVFANQPAAIRSYIDEYKAEYLLYKTDFFADAINGLNAGNVVGE